MENNEQNRILGDIQETENQIDFYKEGLDQTVIGTMLVNSRKHKLKQVEVNITASNDYGLNTRTDIDLVIKNGIKRDIDFHLIDFLFKEAKRKGYVPLAITSLYLENQRTGAKEKHTFPIPTNVKGKIKEKDISQTNTGYSFATIEVMDYRDDHRRPKTRTISLYSDVYTHPMKVGLTPNNLETLFEYVKSRGLVPKKLLHFGLTEEVMHVRSGMDTETIRLEAEEGEELNNVLELVTKGKTTVAVIPKSTVSPSVIRLGRAGRDLSHLLGGKDGYAV